jgi:hypothetical protein
VIFGEIWKNVFKIFSIKISDSEIDWVKRANDSALKNVKVNNSGQCLEL